MLERDTYGAGTIGIASYKSERFVLPQAGMSQQHACAIDTL